MIEDKIWLNNPQQFIIGADEVGRGCFAGPISGAAVRINYSHLPLLEQVKDSKKLSPKKRDQIYNIVTENNIQYSYQSYSNIYIDSFGIKTANERVLLDSIQNIYQIGDLVYVDHFKIKEFNAVSVIKGEDHCRAIALASIVAKVLRDKFMVELARDYQHYKFDRNKGYGTQEHRDAIKLYGLSDLHRKTFNLMPK